MKQRKTIHICMISYDDYFIKYFWSMICSLLKNIDKKYHVNIFFIHNGMKISTKEKIEQYISQYDTTIQFIEAPKDTFEAYSWIPKSRYVIYYRLKMGDFLPQEIERVIFLDCDIIVPWDISDMRNTDIWNNIVWTVKDCVNWSTQTWLNLKYYFNAGVLLVNLKKWREEKIWNKVLDHMDKNHEKMLLWEQDGLNIILQGKRYHLHPKLNCLNINFNYKESQYQKKEYYEAKRHPVIIHYAGSQHRPRGWRLCVHPKWYLYYYYIFKTPRWDKNDIYKIPLRLLTSNPLTYFIYRLARILFHKK